MSTRSAYCVDREHSELGTDRDWDTLENLDTGILKQPVSTKPATIAGDVVDAGAVHQVGTRSELRA